MTPLWRAIRPNASPYGHWLAARGRRIGAYFATSGGDRRQRIATLMTEYGSAGLVDREPIRARHPP